MQLRCNLDGKKNYDTPIEDNNKIVRKKILHHMERLEEK